MKFVIETARHQHLVRDEAALREKHGAFIARLRAGGHAAEIHSDSDPLKAYVSHGQWVALCDCGAGVATDPSFSNAFCFGCGAIHTNVVFPPAEDRAHIEQALLARKKSENRNWNPDETLEQLLADNASHGVGQ